MKKLLTRIAVRVEEVWGLWQERSRVGSAGEGVRSCASHNVRVMWGRVWDLAADLEQLKTLLGSACDVSTLRKSLADTWGPPPGVAYVA